MDDVVFVPDHRSAVWRRELESQGVVLAPGFLSSAESRALEEAVDALIAADVPRSRQVLYTHDAAPGDRPHFDTLMHQWLNPHRLAGPAGTRAIADALRPRVARVLGAESVLLQDLILVKRPGHRRFPWHQDFPFWPIDRPLGVIVWTPLVHTDEHTGGLLFACGSHRLDPWPSLDLHSGLTQQSARDPGPMLGACEVLRPRLGVGDAAIFSPLTFHMSPAKERGPARAAWSSIWLHPSVRWHHARAPRHPICREVRDGAPVTDWPQADLAGAGA